MQSSTECHIHVTSGIAGDEVCCLGMSTAEMAETSVATFKERVAESVGFPAVGIQLLSAGACLSDNSSFLSQVLAPDTESDGSSFTIDCVLESSKPFGGANAKVRRPRMFGSKGGMILARDVTRAQASGRKVMHSNREVNPEHCDSISQLLTSAFAKHLGPMIEMGLRAARCAEGPQMKYVYQDSDREAYVDLSACQVWTSTLDENFRKGTSFPFREGPVVCAVMWRMLPCWEGIPANVGILGVAEGPVLEVLFLATAEDFRQTGAALELVNELEDMARQMRCSAIAVAAVPHQGIQFWQRNGYKVEVPLVTVDADSKPAESHGPGLEEPVTPLGIFLHDNMVLFTDSPLCAKILSTTPAVIAVGSPADEPAIAQEQ